MSTLLYGTGIHPLIYKAENFGTGKTVTAYIWSPTYVKSALQTFTENEEGFYYLAYNFTVVGTYHAKLYEDAVAKTPGTYRVIAAFNDLSASDINTQVADVLKVDTIAEMAQGAPPASPTFEEAVNYLYRKLRNETQTTATEDAVLDDAGTTKLFKAVLSTTSTTFTKGEFGSGA